MQYLALSALLVLLPSVAVAQAEEGFSYEGPGFTAILPAAFALNASLEQKLPDFAMYSFVDEESWRFVSVSIHTYFDAAQRVAWGDDETRDQRLGHLRHVTVLEVEPMPWPVSAMYAFEHAGAAGMSAFGCDTARCYQVTISGPKGDLDSTPGLFGKLASGIAFER